MKSKILGGIFLVCGTSIGTGILGIPSITAGSGFGYSIFAFILCWIASTVAALFLMEAHLWEKKPNTDLLNMTYHAFGSSARFFIWIIYLALLYSLMCTYLLAGSSWIMVSFTTGLHIPLTKIPAMILFICFIGLFIFFGIRVVDRVNRLMSIGLGLCFIAILCITFPHVTETVLFDKTNQLSAMPLALPLLITAFGYSIIVPSLNHYFNKNVNAMRLTIVVGSFITLLTYILWEWATLGNIPFLGEYGLRAIAHSQDNGTEVANALVRATHHPHLSIILTLFAVFAVITSFLGVSMALYHALYDGIAVQSRRALKCLALVLTYIPPIIFLLIFPTGFSQILSWAGVLVAVLLGLLPVALVWNGRYIKKAKGYRVWGGKPLLILTTLFFIGVMIAEFCR